MVYVVVVVLERTLFNMTARRSILIQLLLLLRP